MPLNKSQFVTRHETDKEEESFSGEDNRTSVVISKPVSRGKGKRSIEDMMMSMPSDSTQAVYALERIASLEDQIGKILELCRPGALRLILEERASLTRYAPDTDT